MLQWVWSCFSLLLPTLKRIKRTLNGIHKSHLITLTNISQFMAPNSLVKTVAVMCQRCWSLNVLSPIIPTLPLAPQWLIVLVCSLTLILHRDACSFPSWPLWEYGIGYLFSVPDLYITLLQYHLLSYHTHHSPCYHTGCKKPQSNKIKGTLLEWMCVWECKAFFFAKNQLLTHYTE